MQAKTIDDSTIYYRFAGQPAGNTLIFVNSLGTDWRVWESVAERFGGRFRLLFHDKRGHGMSDLPGGPLRIEDHVSDLDRLLSELDIEPAVICGLSVGGMIALGLAAARPEAVRGLVLCDTGHRVGTAELWNGRIESVERDGLAGIADGVMERWLSARFREEHPGQTALWRNMLLRTPAEGYTATCAALRDADLTAAAQGLGVPALCLCGTEDLATPPALVRELSTLIPDARYRDVPGAAHLPTVEAPAVVAEYIEEYLRDLGFV